MVLALSKDQRAEDVATVDAALAASPDSVTRLVLQMHREMLTIEGIDDDPMVELMDPPDPNVYVDTDLMLAQIGEDVMCRPGATVIAEMTPFDLFGYSTVSARDKDTGEVLAAKRVHWRDVVKVDDQSS